MYYTGRFWNRPRPFHIFSFFGFAVMGLFFAGVMALLFGLALLLLWNWLMPVIFGLPLITFWQAWGLIVLSHIFFKSSPHHFRREPFESGWKHKFHDRFWRRGSFDDGDEETQDA